MVCSGHVFSSQSPTDIGVIMMFHSPPTKVGVKVARHISSLMRKEEEEKEEEGEEEEDEEEEEKGGEEK